MKVEVTVIHEPIYLARPYGVLCSCCGAVAACVTKEEAEESKRIHEAQHESVIK